MGLHLKLDNLEYALRLICSPRKLKFVSAPLNIVDLLAILPYFICFVVDGLEVFTAFMLLINGTSPLKMLSLTSFTINYDIEFKVNSLQDIVGIK